MQAILSRRHFRPRNTRNFCSEAANTKKVPPLERRGIYAQGRTIDARARETKKPTVGELLTFKLLVSRSATSLHLHS